jgi:hypothetical protein
MCLEIPSKQLRNVGTQPSELHIKLLDGLRNIIVLAPATLGLAPQEESLCENASMRISSENLERTEKLLIARIAMNIEVQRVAAIHDATIILKHSGCRPLHRIQ